MNALFVVLCAIIVFSAAFGFTIYVKKNSNGCNCACRKDLSKSCKIKNRI